MFHGTALKRAQCTWC